VRALLDIVLILLQLGIWVLIAQAILSWLIAFNVVNTRNRFVEGLWRILHQITEPFCRPIRRMLPNMSGIDLSPLILILIIIFLERVIIYYIYPSVI
jgi:YggT family protein